MWRMHEQRHFGARQERVSRRTFQVQLPWRLRLIVHPLDPPHAISPSVLDASAPPHPALPMLRTSILVLTIASVLGLGWVTRAFASPWRRAVVQERFEKVERVDLAGLATIELPPSFKPVGRGQDGGRPGHFGPGTLEQHRDGYQITFRFEEGQHHVRGGYLADPVLLHVTLFNPAMPKPDATKITFTTIFRFYPPVNNDRPRLDAHFAAQRWLPEIVAGDVVTRSAATGEGRGDDLASGPPARWLVIHVDPTRRIRVDFYAWRKTYSIEEAQALVRRIAESVQTTPKLAAMFDGVQDAGAREEAKFETTVSDALAALSQCGIRSMGPGMTAWSNRCASWLSDDRRFLRVARTMGRIPLASATDRSQDAPRFEVAMPTGRSPKLIGPPDFRMAQLFWDEPRRRWSIGGFGDRLFDGDAIDADLMEAIVPRLRDRASVHLIALANYDLRFRPERVAIPEFIAEADRVAKALREGKVVPGVRAAPYEFER